MAPGGRDAAIVALRKSDGSLIWSYRRVANSVANTATPIARGNQVFLSSDYGTGAALLELAANGSEVSASEVYFTRDMRNHHASSVLVGDHLYGFSSSILTAMRFETGKVAWRDRSVPPPGPSPSLPTGSCSCATRTRSTPTT